ARCVAAVRAARPDIRFSRVLPVVLFGAALAGVVALPSDWAQLHPSPYKELSQTLAISGMRIIAERSSPLGQVAVVESSRVPFRHAPGQSLTSTHETPPQLAI